MLLPLWKSPTIMSFVPTEIECVQYHTPVQCTMRRRRTFGPAECVQIPRRHFQYTLPDKIRWVHASELQVLDALGHLIDDHCLPHLEPVFS